MAKIRTHQKDNAEPFSIQTQIPRVIDARDARQLNNAAPVAILVGGARKLEEILWRLVEIQILLH